MRHIESRGREVQHRQVLRQDALHVQEQASTLLLVRRRGLLRHERVDARLPLRRGRLLVHVPEVGRPGDQPEIEVARRMGIDKAMLIDDQMTVYLTPAMQQRVELKENLKTVVTGVKP